jgi:hypothetical protein
LSADTDLAQVGAPVHYNVHVLNQGTQMLKDLVIVDVVADELDVTSVPADPSADAISLGSSRTGEDIVWIVNELAPGASIDLPWAARVSQTGDYSADNTVTAKAKGVDKKTAGHRTYVGDVLGSRVKNPAPSGTKRVVTYKTVPVAGGSVQPLVIPATLPATGTTIWPFVGLALALILLGAIMVRVAGTPKKARSLVVVLLLLLGACVSTPDSHVASSSPSPVISPRVLGKKITRRGPQGPDTKDSSSNGTATTAANDSTASDAGLTPITTPSLVAEVPQTETIKQVDEVPITAADLDVATQPDLDAANTMSIVWSSVGVESAASSVSFDSAATAEVLTSLEPNSRAVMVTVTLRNLLSDQRLAVHGHFAHEITGSNGFHAQLVSEPVDVILNPDGETSVSFVYDLPDDSYTLGASFLSD